MNRTTVISAIFTVLLILNQTGSAQEYPGVMLFAEYLDLLASGNYESAQMLWSPEARERSGRFGIQFTNIPLKIDCTSPIVRNLKVMASYLWPPVKRFEEWPYGGCSRMLFSKVVVNQNVEHPYYAVEREGWHWLTYPQDCFADGWSVRESRYFRVRIHPDREKYVHTAILEESDLLLEKLGRTLGLSDEQLENIAAEKVEFFYCSSDKDVEKITGHLTWGTFDMASNDIISANFPHMHELVYLLLNVRFKDCPLFTLPLLREGTAVCFGGRWGKDPESLMDLASLLYRQGLIELDSVLTVTGFERHADADIAYPVVGLFVTYLAEEMGLEPFMDLYLSLSGPIDSLRNLTSDDIERIIMTKAGKVTWEELISDFNEYVDHRPESHANVIPGASDLGQNLISGAGYSVYDNGDWLTFKFTGQSAPPQGSLFFGSDDRLDGGKSALFFEHFGDRYSLDGYRFAVRFDPNEAGLYDYASNRLLAKYIVGVSPPGEYIDAETGTICVRFREALFGNHLPTEGDCRLLPE